MGEDEFVEEGEEEGEEEEDDFHGCGGGEGGGNFDFGGDNFSEKHVYLDLWVLLLQR